MAIISPSLQFEGQAVSKADAGRIIIPDVRLINFRSKENKDGVYLYILPPYKADSQNRGVWYKVIDVRSDFGTSMKERFVETPDSPIAYFDNQVKHKYPDYCEVQKVMRDGREVKVYPTFGRVTKRFLYNVAYAADLSQGAHVAEVPNYGVADVIDRYHRTKLLNGQMPSIVCDPKQATPILFHLNLDVRGGQPWQVQPEPTQKSVLPDELADTEYLYNLDEVCIVPDNDELYEKLRVVTPAPIFNDCMQGWGTKGAVNVGFTPAAEPAQPAVSAPIAKPIAKATINKPAAGLSNLSATPPPTTPTQAEVERVTVSNVSNPVASTNPALAQWLKPKPTANG